MARLLKNNLKDMIPDKLSHLKLSTSRIVGKKTVRSVGYHEQKVEYRYIRSILISLEPLIINELNVGCLFSGRSEPYDYEYNRLHIRLECIMKSVAGDDIISPEAIDYMIYFFEEYGEGTFLEKLKEKLDDNFFPLLETIFIKKVE